MKRGDASAPRRRGKTRLSPLPEVSPYLEDVQRRSFSPMLLRTEKRKRKKLQKTQPLADVKSLRYRNFSPENDSSQATRRQAQFLSAYQTFRDRITFLRQAYSQVLRENLYLVSSSTLCKGAINEETKDLADEQEELYSLLSSSHGSIGELLKRYRSLANDVAKAQRELGLLRYQSDLRVSSKAVKDTLVLPNQLSEVLNHRRSELHQQHSELISLREETAQVEEEVATLYCENVELAESVNELLSTLPHLTVACEGSQELGEVSARLGRSEAKCKALEEEIRKHSK